MKTKDYINSKGACYFAVNAFGWATARSPWEAMAKLDLDAFSRRRPTIGSKTYKEQTAWVSLWYLPDESKFAGTDCYRPVDADGKFYGVPLFCGFGEHNETVIHNTLTSIP